MDAESSTAAWIELADGERVSFRGNCALGRSKTSTVVISEERASRNHATIHLQDGGEFWLIDLGSVNGTRLNDRRVVRPVRLKDADRIVIAETTLIFRKPAGDEGDGEDLDAAMVTVEEVRSEARWLLLADLENFTPLSQRLSAEELATLVGRWMRASGEIVDAHDGAVNKYLGDGWLACWASANVDRVAATVVALRALREAEPKFRVIVHHGTVAISGAAALGEEGLMGPEVNFLFRVEKIAGAAGVPFCFTAEAQARLGALLPLEAVPGRHTLKGFVGDYAFFRL